MPEVDPGCRSSTRVAQWPARAQDLKDGEGYGWSLPDGVGAHFGRIQGTAAKESSVINHKAISFRELAVDGQGCSSIICFPIVIIVSAHKHHAREARPCLSRGSIQMQSGCIQICSDVARQMSSNDSRRDPEP